MTQSFRAGPTSEAAGGRRRSFIEDARRAQIISAAVKVIADVGYVNATMARIAAAAGIAKGLLSYHFRDKDELMEQTMVVVHARVTTEVVGGIDLTAPAPEVMRAIIRRVAAYGAQHREEIRTLNQIAQNLRRADGQLRFTLADNDEIYKASEQLYLRGRREGHLRRFDTRVMAVTFQAALDAMFAYAEAYPDTDLVAYADRLTDLLVSAVSLPPGAAKGARASSTSRRTRTASGPEADDTSVPSRAPDDQRKPRRASRDSASPVAQPR